MTFHALLLERSGVSYLVVLYKLVFDFRHGQILTAPVVMLTLKVTRKYVLYIMVTLVCNIHQ